VKLRLYHGSKPEGRLQLEEAINEAAAGMRKDLGSMQARLAVCIQCGCGISKKCCYKLETSMLLQMFKLKTKKGELESSFIATLSWCLT
jgi:hypothetical protein